MADIQKIDRNAGVRIVDAEVLKPTSADGSDDHSKSDYLKVTVNDTNREVKVEATNDDGTVTEVPLIFLAKGRGARIPKLTTAQRDALNLAAGDAGEVIYNSTTNKINFWTGAAWEVVTSA
ncbi:MAG: hypothetical protein D6692_05430 [Planctomycetota bacterium]|nr:MAG: hypothetical protein D6692_05430 [Planctomycetota bacterium]